MPAQTETMDLDEAVSQIAILLQEVHRHGFGVVEARVEAIGGGKRAITISYLKSRRVVTPSADARQVG
ncbi:hypothetical protein JW921_11705 [Candidatus Fermentibacterales bacterium]|nr:hypothetical protein [Candidatus Fermentibacterales bacterium]